MTTNNRRLLTIDDIRRMSEQVIENIRAEAEPHFCADCAAYLERRRRVLLPFIGRWVQRQRPDRPPLPPAVFVDRIRAAHHRNVCKAGDSR